MLHTPKAAVLARAAAFCRSFPFETACRRWKPNGTTGPKRFRSGSRSCETVFDYDGKLKQAADIEDAHGGARFLEQSGAGPRDGRPAQGAQGAFSSRWTKSCESGGDLPGMLELAEGDDGFAGEVRGEIERLEQRARRAGAEVAA